MLYMFQAVPPPIIRSAKMYTPPLGYVKLCLLLLLALAASKLDSFMLYTHSIWYMSSLLAATASGSRLDSFMLCAQF
jgi:hypothetical protein